MGNRYFNNDGCTTVYGCGIQHNYHTLNNYQNTNLYHIHDIIDIPKKLTL